MDELPRGPELFWTSGRDIKAGKAAPSTQPSGFTSLGAGGDKHHFILGLGITIGGWGKGAWLAPFWSGEGDPAEQGLGQARQVGPLETLKQAAEDGDLAPPHLPSVCVSLIPPPTWWEACAATTTSSLRHGALSDPKCLESHVFMADTCARSTGAA